MDYNNRFGHSGSHSLDDVFNNSDDSHDDGLDSLLGDPQDSEEDSPQDDLGETQDEGHEDTQVDTEDSAEEQPLEEEDSSEDTQDTASQDMDDIEEYLITAPRNATTEPTYSERDVYQIINTVSILSMMTEEHKQWIESLLGIGGDDVRKSMRIASMDNLDTHLSQVESLKDIVAVADEQDASKAVTKILGAIHTVSSMAEDDRDSMITLIRKIIRDNDITVPSKINKRASDAELVDNVRDVVLENPVVKGDIDTLIKCVDMIASARR